MRIPNVKLWIPAFTGMTVLLASFSAFALVSPKTVNVLADPDISLAIVQIARNYARDRQVVVNTSFAPQAAQAAQIAEGAAADVLITLNASWIEQLKTQGLVDIHSPTVIAHNRLALVAPPDSTLKETAGHKFPAAALITAVRGRQAFVAGNPETLAVGVYGKEALRNLGVAGELEPYTLYIKDPDAMIDMVTKEGAYGLFFYSTVIHRTDLRVVDVLPENSHRPIAYTAAVIAGDNMDEAREFLHYLKSPGARRIFRENGFVED